MKYKFFPTTVSDYCSTPWRRAKLDGQLKAGFGLPFTQLSLHPELLWSLLSEGRMSFAVFEEKGAASTLVPVLRACDDPLFFAIEVAPHLGQVGEGIAEQFIETARALGVHDSLLSLSRARRRTKCSAITCSAMFEEQLNDARVTLKNCVVKWNAGIAGFQVGIGASFEEPLAVAYIPLRGRTKQRIRKEVPLCVLVGVGTGCY